MSVVFGLTQQSQTRGLGKCLGECETAAAIGIQPIAGLNVQRQQPGDAKYSPAMLGFAACAQHIKAGKQGKKTIQVSIPGKKAFPLVLLDLFPAGLLFRRNGVSGVGGHEKSLDHIAQHRLLLPEVSFLTVQLQAGGRRQPLPAAQNFRSGPCGPCRFPYDREDRSGKTSLQPPGVEFDNRGGDGSNIGRVFQWGMVALAIVAPFFSAGLRGGYRDSEPKGDPLFTVLAHLD